MTLPELILTKLKAGHRGQANAIKRYKLLVFCQAYEPELTDRKMRMLVKQIPRVCSCEDGYFIDAKSRSETDHSIEYLKKKIFPLWDDIKRIQQAYPEYYSSEQMRLF